MGKPARQRTYIAIDLKSFFASVECVERGLNPLTTNLVVADRSRTEKTICLAVSPSLKAYGLKGRARLFEVVECVAQVNYRRRMATAERRLAGKSVQDEELRQHPDWAVDYIAAMPRMALYLDYSARVYRVYLKYIAPEDIHVYSIDEVFIDATAYLHHYASAHELAMTMIRDVLRQTGITATAGIGTNLYLCKVAMDIVAKHIPADEDGVRIAELDEWSYRERLWTHKPLTDFWRVGKGIARRLEAHGARTMGDVARLSLNNEDLLYRLFGVNAELLIDHAWGWEPCTMEAIKAYRPETNSMSSGQVLQQPYTAGKARVVVREMADNLAMALLEKRLVADQVVVTVGYDRASLGDQWSPSAYEGDVVLDHYGRAVPKPAHGSRRLGRATSSASLIGAAVWAVFDRIVDASLLVRRLNVTLAHVVPEDRQGNHAPVQLDLFADGGCQQPGDEQARRAAAKERRLQETLMNIKRQYGKNAILKGLNFADGATAVQRNQQIGGHKA